MNFSKDPESPERIEWALSEIDARGTHVDYIEYELAILGLREPRGDECDLHVSAMATATAKRVAHPGAPERKMGFTRPSANWHASSSSQSRDGRKHRSGSIEGRS